MMCTLYRVYQELIKLVQAITLIKLRYILLLVFSYTLQCIFHEELCVLSSVEDNITL